MDGVEADRSNTLTHEVIVREYLKALKRRRYSPRTVATYRYPLVLLCAFLAARGVVRLQDVGRDDLSAWRLALLERGLTDASLEVFLRAARNLFNWMEAEGMLFDNPGNAIRTPKYARKLQAVPSEADMRLLLGQPKVTTPVGIRDRALMEVGYCCALRREELARLTLRDVDFMRRTLRVMGKGSRERVLPLGEQAFAWLTRYVEQARPKLLRGDAGAPALDALWIGVGGKPIGGQGICVTIKQYGRKAKLPVGMSPHGLRRACATHMLRNGAHPLQIRMLLGHASMRHLAQYLRLTIADIKRMHAESRPGK